MGFERAPLTPLQGRIVWTCWLVGGLLRLIYCLVIHLPNAHVYSDMHGYVQRALDLMAGKPETIADSLYPPGASRLFALLLKLDSNGGMVVIVQWLLALGSMACVFVIARRLYGNWTAVLSLLVVTFYLPLFHYAGLFLAENPFTFCLLAAYALLICAIDAQRAIPTFLLGLGAGLMAALAASLKATILLPVLLSGVVVIVWMLKHKQRGAPSLSAGVVIGLALLLIPMSQRCTRLAEGTFCLVSTNTGMNAVMGHYGESLAFQWVDAAHNYTFTFQSPSASLHAYQGQVHFTFGAYDVPANLAELHRYIDAHPAEAFALSLRNVADLYVGGGFWPAAVVRGADWSIIYQQLFQLLLLPAAIGWLLYRTPAMLRLRFDSLPEWLLLTPILGLMLTAFISLGEVRFRIPFDGFFIILAMQGWRALVAYLMGRFRTQIAPP